MRAVWEYFPPMKSSKEWDRRGICVFSKRACSVVTIAFCLVVIGSSALAGPKTRPAIKPKAHQLSNDKIAQTDTKRPLDGDQGSAELPRLPVIVGGDVQYTESGEPRYDTGKSLEAVTKFKGLYYGDQSVARFLVQGDDVRLAITSDSQFSGGPNRGLMGMVQSWPFTFSSLPISTTSSDPFFIQRMNPTDFLLSSSWHNRLTQTNQLGVFNSRIQRDSGLNDISEIPMQYMWLSRPLDANIFSGRIYKADEQQRVMYNPKNWIDEGGVFLQMHLCFVQGGETGMADETGAWSFSMRFQHFMPGSDGLSNNDEVVTSPGGPVVQVSLNDDTNSGAKLTMMSSGVFECGGNDANSWVPQWIAREFDTADDASVFVLPGWVQRFQSPLEPDTGFGIPLVRSAAGRNPECFLHGADNGNLVLTNHGSTAKIRNWMWRNYDRPNALMYSFGHNGPEREINNPRAASVFQGDLFDLIYQDCHDLQSLNGEMPRVLVFIPWVGANMNAQRHDEMLGVVKALNEIGIPALALSGFNRFGGEVFNEEFLLDAMNLHPGNEIAAEDAWGEVYGILELASRVIYRGGGN